MDKDDILNKLSKAKEKVSEGAKASMDKVKSAMVEMGSESHEDVGPTTTVPEQKENDSVKNGIVLAKDQIVKVVGSLSKAGKDAQKAVLAYVDRKKNAKFLQTKLQSFEDGMKAGKVEAVDYIKKYANFCLAATAISFFFARCDGDISEEEQLEIQFDLDAIIKNRDLPEELRNKLAEISLDRDLTFDEVKLYLDGVSVETVQEFKKDIEEIIIADGTVTDAEKEAKQLFDDYLKKRLEG